jgi:transcriptional regulator with XRE-family HTH domain
MSVAEERQKRKLTQPQAALVANVSLRTWQRWEASDDPNAYAVFGIAVPRKARRTRILQVLLTEKAASIIDDIPAGKRSRWVNSLIEEGKP